MQTEYGKKYEDKSAHDRSNCFFLPSLITFTISSLFICVLRTILSKSIKRFVKCSEPRRIGREYATSFQHFFADVERAKIEREYMQDWGNY